MLCAEISESRMATNARPVLERMRLTMASVDATVISRHKK